VPDTEFEFTPCCNDHDICYAECGISKSTCDEEFEDCLGKVCLEDTGDRGECEATISLFSLAASTLGCQSFLDTQREACKCAPLREL